MVRLYTRTFYLIFIPMQNYKLNRHYQGVFLQPSLWKRNAQNVKKISKHGAFLGCIKWPECNGTRDIDGNTTQDKTVETGHKCPDCSNILILREGKNGKFFGCKSYPECKTTAKIGEDGSPIFFEKKTNENSVACEKCKKGKMIERSGKFGKFLGCSNYPKCKNILK